MPRFCSTRPILRARTGAHPTPRGGIDPIESAADALAVLGLAMPLGNDTVAILLDHDRRGHGIFVVTGTVDPDALFTVIDACVEATHPSVGGLIVASSRPGGDVAPSDIDRWFRASEQVELGGLELVEWFVIGANIRLPRELAGEPARWHVR